MLFLAEAPLLFLLMPHRKFYELCFVFAYFLFCLWLKNRTSLSLRLRHFVVDLALSAYCTACFYSRWSSQAAVIKFAEILRINASLLTLFAGIVLGLLALPGLDALVTYLSQQQVDLAEVNNVPSPRSKLSRTEILCCAGISLLTALQFSTCPFSSNYPHIDASVFLTIGRRMHDGLMPYRDMFDHKGPFLYFINWLGMFLRWESAPFLGVWLLEIVNMFVFSAAMVKLLKDTCKPSLRRIPLMITAVICVCCGKIVMVRGDIAEEFILPWSAIALYVFIRYFQTYEYRLRDVFLLGIGLGIALCLRPNLIGIWAVLTPAVLISLLLRRRFADVGRCILSYTLGLLTILIPTFIWLYSAGILSAMWQCYIEFNFAYVDYDLTPFSFLASAWHGLYLLPIALPSLILGLSLARKQKAYWVNLFAGAGVVALMFISGHVTTHYSIPLLPLLGVPLAVIMPRKDVFDALNAKMLRRLTAAFTAAIIVFGLFVAAPSLSGYHGDSIVRYLKENTSPTDDVLIVGNSCRYYVLSDRYTRNRFIFQTQPTRISDALYADFLNEFEIHPSDVILVPQDSREEDLANESYFSRIFRLFDEHYRNGEFTLEEYDGFYLYRRVKA